MRTRDIRDRGFSLVELLVVMVIVGILIALLVPALMHVRGEARVVQCRSQLRQMGVALHAYAVDHDDRMLAGPPAFGEHHRPDLPSPLLMLPDGDAGVVRHTSHGLLIRYDYIDTPELFLCPSAEGFAAQSIRSLLAGEEPETVFSSYIYRQVGEATGTRIQGLGVNSAGEPARALAFHHTTVPDEGADIWTHALSTVHHGGREVNILADDGHVRSPDPAIDDQFAFVDDYFAEYPAIVQRADRAVVR